VLVSFGVIFHNTGLIAWGIASKPITPGFSSVGYSYPADDGYLDLWHKTYNALAEVFWIIASIGTFIAFIVLIFGNPRHSNHASTRSP